MNKAAICVATIHLESILTVEINPIRVNILIKVIEKILIIIIIIIKILKVVMLCRL